MNFWHKLVIKKNTSYEFRARDVHAIWLPHALPDKRNVSRAEIRSIINDYMTTVMHEEPIDPSLLEFDDSQSW